MKTIEELILQLPEIIICNDERAFLEITSSHVYYSRKHDNQGNLQCCYVSFGELRFNLERAYQWILDGIEIGNIVIIDD